MRLEHFQKCYSHSAEGSGGAVFLVFGFVSAQLSRYIGTPSPKPRQKPKILAPNGYKIFSNALKSAIQYLTGAAKTSHSLDAMKGNGRVFHLCSIDFDVHHGFDAAGKITSPFLKRQLATGDR